VQAKRKESATVIEQLVICNDSLLDGVDQVKVACAVRACP
jgi:hypothetical protein